MPAPPELLDLTDHFARNLDAFKRGVYNEAQVRVEFIDPLFAALGWDVHNRTDYADPADGARHDQMVALVQRMLALHKQLAAATVPHSRELFQRQIDATDARIDGLVYELRVD